eukprot:CAMPEP_0175880148 /NCGR_PEP_ID=MMETSP0107_2-20121207/42158_1 /TAXON_ID=195067 ORGANISM="Goniomonas pacifica, Strain CCMP1869" /NCGR_SAMPLE_ID=MMETSP0107_2 /ASSEMBLY_ACC=CAM_ASM_000203 /LENGTH=76 /DNA_ID=CAMNT_0017199863 /DNA_START=323 /DNA_END=553 /DNA_ORIENTATION=+
MSVSMVIAMARMGCRSICTVTVTPMICTGIVRSVVSCPRCGGSGSSNPGVSLTGLSLSGVPLTRPSLPSGMSLSGV